MSSVRLSSRLKENTTTTVPAAVMEILWNLCVIGSRVVAMAVFTARFQAWLLLVVGIHWVVTAIVVILFREEGQENPSDYIIDVVIHTFCVHADKGESRLCRYTFYHFVMFTENVLMSVLWYTTTQSQDVSYHTPCMVIIILGYILGVIFQIIYNVINGWWLP